MLNTSCPHEFPGRELISTPSLSTCHGQTSMLQFCHVHVHVQSTTVMFLLHDVSTSLSFLLLLAHFVSFLLVKLFGFLLREDAHEEADKGITIAQVTSPKDRDEEPAEVTTDECCSEKEDLLAEFFGGEEGLFFFYGESVVQDTFDIKEVRDSSTHQHHLELEVEATDDTFVLEATPYPSPDEDSADHVAIENNKHEISYGDVALSDDVTTPPHSTPSPTLSTSPENSKLGDEKIHEEEDFGANYGEKDLLEKEKLLVIDHIISHQSDGKSFRLLPEGAPGDGETTLGGCYSFTCESTSKSSMEWRSSTIFRDSETEYPFSSSSRRSSSNWETFALFRKYDEDMTFFDRISAQKLTETESFRSLKYQPRSVSQRIVHKFVAKNKKLGRDPYQDLESAYVSQVCLVWEALNLNYSNFRRLTANRDMGEVACCPARIAQQFQQFQVLLQRFIEMEPYENGRRPEIFARVRKLSPKLLQVPEFRDSEDDESKEDMIASIEFLVILEDAIRTFMNFLKADRETPCQMLRALIKRSKSTSVDPRHLHLLRKANKKKKMRLKDLVRSRKCLTRRKLKGQQEMEILMGLIDLKVVSRVLRVPEISMEQLHWCEQKMTKVRVADGKIQRDSSPLFFPVH